jgi:hypothetical protein
MKKEPKQAEKDIKLVSNMNVQCCQEAEISAAKPKKGQKNCMGFNSGFGVLTTGQSPRPPLQ